MIRRMTFLLLVSVIIISAREKSTSPLSQNEIDYSTVTEIEYSSHVQPLFNRFCTDCHSGKNASAGLSLESWSNMTRGSRFGEALIPYDAENSLMIELFTKLTTGTHLSEKGRPVPDSVDIAFLIRWITEGAVNDEGLSPYQDSENRLYVCNQGSGMVSVFDTEAKLVIRNIDFQDYGYSSNSKPHDVAVEPDGSFLYVSLINDGKVLKFSRNFQLIDEVDFSAAGLLAIHPTKDLPYVGHTLSIPDVPQTLGAIRRSDMVLQQISVPYLRPHTLAADRQGRYIYNISLVDNVIGIIDSEDNPSEICFLSVLPGDKRNLIQLNVAPDGQSFVVSSQLSAELFIIDSRDPGNLRRIDTVAVEDHPWHPKYSPDGRNIWVGNNVSHSISVVNINTMVQETVIGRGDGSDGLAEPHGLVFSPDGRYVFVTNRNQNMPAEYTPRYHLGDNANSGTIVVIEAISKEILKVIEIEKFPSEVAVDPL